MQGHRNRGAAINDWCAGMQTRDVKAADAAPEKSTKTAQVTASECEPENVDVAAAAAAGNATA